MVLVSWCACLGCGRSVCLLSGVGAWHAMCVGVGVMVVVSWCVVFARSGEEWFKLCWHVCGDVAKRFWERLLGRRSPRSYGLLPVAAGASSCPQSGEEVPNQHCAGPAPTMLVGIGGRCRRSLSICIWRGRVCRSSCCMFWQLLLMADANSCPEGREMQPGQPIG